MSHTLAHRSLTTRSLRIGDAPAIAEILAAMERAEPTDEAYSEQDIVEELSAPGIDLARGSIGLVDRDRLVAFGWLVISAPSEQWKAAVEGGVHPDCTGRGLGRRIVQTLADQARSIRDADAPGQPGQLKIWVPANRRRTAALAAAAGFETWRYFLRMRRDLREPLERGPVPPGVEVRTYRPSDDDAVRLVSNESFADHWGSTAMDPARWRAEYADSSSFRPEHSHVALVDGAVVSFVLTSEFDAETDLRGYPTGYVARVGTSRRARGRHIASALINRTLAGLQASGYRYAELGVDADSPTGAGHLYERAGFATIECNEVVGRHF